LSSALIFFAAIVGYTSPEMIVKNYAGFIKDNHLKIDTNVELFKNSCCNTVTLKKMSDLKNA